jgi:7-cyano-7-deazaguanine reductase
MNHPSVQSNPSSGKEISAESFAESSTEIKYGERHIAEGQLITFPNPRLGRRYTIQITLPEFTCKCPFSGYPDFATIAINYVPNERVVELKAINQILDDFVAACDPLEVTIKGDFAPRGNVHTVIEAHHQKPVVP